MHAEINEFHTLDFSIQEKSKKAPCTSAIVWVRSMTLAVRPRKKKPKVINYDGYDGYILKPQ